MISTLYEKFKDWSDGGSVYLYGDTHFCDPDCKKMDPNWITPEEQVQIINQKMGKNDTFVHLGDVGDISYIPKIRAGRKILICGNHDVGATQYKRAVINGVDNHLFDEVYTGPLMISEKIILSHEPIPNINWALNIHGHDHSGAYIDEYHYNLCSNTINYTPVNLRDIIKSGALNKVDSLHRLTIDKATERRKHR